MTAPRLIPGVLDQHCEEAAFLWTLRRRFLTRADISLADLAGMDERIDAHLDGIRNAQERGWKSSQEMLAKAGVGEVFACATLALEFNTSKRISSLLAAVEAEPLLWPGLVGALGWASPQDLQRPVMALLAADSPFHRRIGIASCAVHRVDAGTSLTTSCEHRDLALSRRSLRTVGELGRLDLLPVCMDQLAAEDPERAFWAAWSTVLLGDRLQALEKLAHIGLSSSSPLPARLRLRALRLALNAMDMAQGHEWLRALGRDPKNRRMLVEGTGILGGTRYVPWLIQQMEAVKLARLAGEAFSLMTGVDIAAMNLRRQAPQALDSGPDADPANVNVEMDDDDSLPWPDPAKIQKWWDANAQRFQSSGRYFMGEPVNIESCKRVMREGYQRQRIAAALLLATLQPGTPLFPTGAPAWRQQRWLAKMG